MAIILRLNRKKIRGLKWMAAGILLVAGILFLDYRIRPMLTTVFTYQANLAVTRSINEAVLSVIEEKQVAYNQIISVKQDEQGAPAYLETNMVTLNRLKARLTNEISDRLEKDAQTPLKISLGSILGGQYFAGRGPEVHFSIHPVDYVKTDFHNEFTTAGINQTLHQVMLDVQVPVAAVLPVHQIATTVTSEVCIAETVIVGKVPQAFTEINGDRSDMIGLYNDHKSDLSDLAG